MYIQVVLNISVLVHYYAFLNIVACAITPLNVRKVLFAITILVSFVYMYTHEQSLKEMLKERQGNNNNTTERQSNATQLARNSHFSNKNWLPRVGFKPTTISSPGDALTN